jgi:hypothetical protein
MDRLENTIAGTTNQEKKINLIRSNYKESYDYLSSSGYIKEQKLWHDLARSIPKSGKKVWMSNKFIPMTMAKIDSALSNLMDILFQSKPPIEVKVQPYGLGDEFHAGIIKTLLSKQIDDDGFFLKMVQYIKNLLTYGTSIGYVCWEQVKKTVYRKVKTIERMVDYFGTDITNLVPATRQLFKGYSKKDQEVIIEGPKFEPCNIGDVFPDPQSIEVNDGFLVWKIRRTIAHLRLNMKTPENPGGMYNDEVLKLRKSDSCEYKEGKDNVEGNTGRQLNMPVTREDLGTMIEIIYWFGKYDTNDDGKQENCIMAIAGQGNYLIRDDSEVYWHGENGFVKGGYSLDPNEFYHIGIPEQLADLQDNMNETVNQRIDNITLCLNPVMKYLNNQGIRIKEWVMGPGKTIGMDDPKAVAWDRPPDVTQSNFAHVADIERWAQEVSVPKITMGITGAELNKTATGMNILAQGAMDKTMLVAKIVESTSFSKILKLFYELDYQMLDEYSIAKIIGIDDPKQIDMDKMNPDYYSIEPAGVKALGDSNQKALKLMQAQNIYKNEPWFKAREAGIKTIELLRITDNPRELVRTEEETAQIEQERAAEERAKLMVMTMMNAKAGSMGIGKGSASTQFQGGETNQASAGGVPPNTTPIAPEPDISNP